MKKRTRHIFEVLALFSCSANLMAQHKSDDQKPNIVVFIADDAGMDFGCYGNAGIKTPNIDKLAKDGLKFQNAYLTSPQSSPSRTSMMTGMFAHTIGTEDLHDILNPTTKMMPYYFNEVGYTTAVMVKTHWGKNGDKQFSQIIKGGYLPNEAGISDELYDNYQEFLDNNKTNPFFLWVGFIDPHRPYNRDVCPQKNKPENVTVPPFLADTPETRRDLADYYDEISRMDSDIGKMIEEMDKRGLLENTIIVFLSDNGRPFPRCKGSLYDTGIHTPLIFTWKNRIKAGSIHQNGLISTVDLAPTLLDIAEVSPKEDMFGRSFKNILFDSSKRGRDYIFAERNWHDTDEYIRCIRTEKYKLIYNAYYELPHGIAMDLSSSPSWYELKRLQREGKLNKEQSLQFASPRAMIEIYDLEKDPYELDNVADKPEYLKEGKRMARLLVDWQKETKDIPWWKKRRIDQNDRITGFPFYETKPDLWVE